MERLYGQMEANPRNEPGSHKMRLKEHLNPAEITIERKNESSEDEELIKDIQRAKKQSLKYINNEEVVSDYETEEDIEEIIEASEEVEEEVNVDDEELIDDTIEIDNNDIPEDNIGLIFFLFTNHSFLIKT